MTIKCLFLSASLLLVPAAALAQDHDDHDHHDHSHEAAVGDITVSHPWARAAAAGGDTLVFMEFINDGGADVLTAIESEVAAEAGIVGISFAGGDMATVAFDTFEIPAGDFDFDPAGVAIQLVGLTQALSEGDVFELELTFETAGTLHIDVEVEAANATQHSHAGHAH